MVAGTGGAKSGAVDPKLVALRQQMAYAEDGKGIDVYIIPTEDPHMVRGAGWQCTDQRLRAKNRHAQHSHGWSLPADHSFDRASPL